MRALPLKALGALAMLACLGVMAATSARTAEHLRPMLEDYAAHKTGLDVAVARLEIHALPPEVVLTGLSARARADAQAAGDVPVSVSVMTVRLKPAFLPTLWGEPTLADAAIEGVRIAGSMQAVRRLWPEEPLETAPAKRPYWPIDADNMALRDVDVTLTDGPQELAVWGLQAQVHRAGWHQRAWQLTMVGAQVRDPQIGAGRAVPIRLEGHGRIDGGLHRPRRLGIERATLTAPGASLILAGTWNLTKPEATQLTATLDGDLRALGLWHGSVAPWQGNVHAVVRARAPSQDADYDLLVQVQNFGRAQDAPLGDIIAEADGSRRTVALKSLRWVKRSQTLATVSGRMDVAPPYAFDAVFELQEAPIEPLWSLLFARPSPLSGPMTGHVATLGVMGANFQVQSTLDVSAQPLVLAPNANAAVPILRLPALRAQGTLLSTPEATTSHNLQLWLRDSLLVLDGAIRHGRAGVGPTLALRLWGGGVNLADLGPIVGVPYTGTAGFGGTLMGALTRPELQGHAQVENLRIGAYALGDAEATVHVDAPVLHLHNLVLARARGDARGELHIAFAAPVTRLRTQLAIGGIDAAEVLTTLSVPLGSAQLLDGRVFGSLTLDGPLIQPEGHATLSVPALQVADVALGPAKLALRFTGGAQRVAATIKVTPSAGTLGGHLFVGRDGGLHLDLMGRALPLGLLPILQRGQVRGEVALQLNAALLGHSREGSLVLDVQDLLLRGQPQGGAHLVARTQGVLGKRLSVALSMLQGSLHAEGDVALDALAHATLRGRFENLNLLSVLPLLGETPQALEAYANLNAAGSGHWQVSGPLADPRALQMQGSITALALSWGSVAVRLREPAQVQMRHGRLTLSRLWLSGPLLDLRAQGILPLDMQTPDLDLRLDARGDLAAVHAVMPDIEGGRGPFTVVGVWGGSWSTPKLIGEATVHEGSLRLHGQERPIEHIEAKAAFTGRTAAITQGSATLGDGRLTLAGEANLGSGSWSEPKGLMSLRLGLRRVPWHPAADVEATLNGSLEFTGGSAEAAVRGEILLGALRYTARIDLDKWVAKRAATPLRAPSGLLGRPWRLGVHVTAPGNIILSSPVLEAELAADLTVTGTTQRVGLIGNVTPLWARARWRDNLFVLTRSSIDFIDEYRVAPQFNVVARTHACQMDADVQIQGGVDGFTVTPVGRDERGIVDPQDVLTCLQFGLRLRDFNGNQKSGATAGAVSSGLDALWTVSGLDAKVRKILPIAVDELRLTSSWSSIAQRTTPRVLVAKDLGHHVSLRYSRSIDEFNDQAFSLDYRVVDHLSLSAGWLTARDVAIGDFGVDSRLHWEID